MAVRAQPLKEACPLRKLSTEMEQTHMESLRRKAKFFRSPLTRMRVDASGLALTRPALW